MFDGGSSDCVDDAVVEARKQDWIALHKRFKRCAKQRTKAEAEEISCLLEAEETKLWEHLAYASLLEYMERELDYKPHTANERLRVAHDLTELPLIELEFRSGEMPYSVVREITRVATAATDEQWLHAARGAVARQAQWMVRGLEKGALPGDPPDPALLRYWIRFEANAEIDAMWRTICTALSEERGERITECEALRILMDAYTQQTAATKKTPIQFAVTVCKDCDRAFINSGTEKLQLDEPSRNRLLSDVEYIGDLTSDALERPKRMENATLAKAATATSAASRAMASVRTAATTASTTTALATAPMHAPDLKLAWVRKEIPAAIERKVKARDGGCIVPGCRAKRNLHIHHLTPRCLGGGNESANLGTLCGGHHRRLHDGLLIIRGTAPHRLDFWWKKHVDDDEIPLTTSPKIG